MTKKIYQINIKTNRGNIIDTYEDKMPLKSAILFAAGIFYGINLKTKFTKVELIEITETGSKIVKVFERQYLYKKSKIMIREVDKITSKHKDCNVQYVLNENENERVGNGYCDFAIIKLKNEIITITHYGDTIVEQIKK